MHPSARYFKLILLSCLAPVLFSACTVKHAPVQPGMIPKVNDAVPGEEEYGQRLFKALCKKHKLDSSHPRYDQLIDAFDQLVEIAEADHLPWQIHVFDESEIVDVRAVHGNYIFVWSGFLDIVQNEDEIAGVLACEMAHALARHTEPVQFTLWSDVFFDVAEMATQIAIFQLSHGMVAIGGRGWLKWAYIHAADLDPLDREYNEAYEKEAAAIALLLISRSKYSPEAMIGFWKRLQKSDAYLDKTIRLNRNLTPQQRITILEDLMPKITEWKQQDTGIIGKDEYELVFYPSIP